MTATLNASTSSGVILTSDTSGTLDLQSNGNTIASVGASGMTINSYVAGASVITSGTAVASTSGTSIDFTSIPSWVKRVTVLFNGVSLSGTSVPRVQLGSNSVTTTGYAGVNLLAGAVSGQATLSAGFDVNTGLSNAGNLFTGTYVFSLITGNTWVGTTALGNSFATVACFIQGSIALSGTLDRIRITTVNGTDTFDAGSINILYE